MVGYPLFCRWLSASPLQTFKEDLKYQTNEIFWLQTKEIFWLETKEIFWLETKEILTLSHNQELPDSPSSTLSPEPEYFFENSFFSQHYVFK